MKPKQDTMKKTKLNVTSLIAIIPILLFGTTWLFEFIVTNKTIQIAMFVVTIASMLIILGIGWVKDFPKWTLHSIGFCILTSLWLTNVSSPSINRTETWGLLALLPLALTLTISVSLHFTLQPLRQLLKQIIEESNILLFLIYGFLPFIFWLEFDEINHASVIPFIIVLTILTALSIVIYLTSTKKIIRTLTLVIGFLVTNTIAISATTMFLNE